MNLNNLKIINKLKSSRIMYFDFNENNLKGKIFYLVDAEKVKVLKSTGNISKLSLEEQELLIAKKYMELFEESMRKYSNYLRLSRIDKRINSFQLKKRK